MLNDQQTPPAQNSQPAPQPTSPSAFMKLFKNKTFLIVLFSSVIMIVAAILLRELTPPTALNISNLPTLKSPLPAPSISSLETNVSLSTQVGFVGSRPELPTEVAIFRSTYGTTTTKSILSQLTTDFSLQPTGESNQWISSNAQQTLFFMEEDGFIIFDSPPSQALLVDFSPKKIVGATQNFMKKYLQKNPSDTFPIIYWIAQEGELEFDESQEPRGQYAYVKLTPTYNSIPIRFKNHSDTKNYILFNSNYEPVRFAITPELYSSEPVAKTTLISIDEAIEKIKSGGFTTVDAYKPLESNADDMKISGTSLTKVELEYRLDPTSNFYTPYYHFYGKTKDNQDAQIYEIEVITPAVALSE